MKNVTIAIKEPVARFARSYAAKQGLALSRFISNYLEQLMETEQGRKAAMGEFFSRGAYFDSKGRRVSRDEIYDRPILR